MVKSEQEYLRKTNENQKKYILTHEMKNTLHEQIKSHNYKKAEEHRVNPEDNSYGIIANMFREKPKPYD